MEKFSTFRKEIQNDGAFRQQENQFATPFGDQEGLIPVVPNKYRLLWMPACPHAHKVVIVRRLLGLENVISLGATGPYRTEHAWEFTNDPGGVDPVLGVQYIEDVYKKADPSYDKRPTVPVVVDIETGKAVNNDHVTLTLQLETEWKKYHKEGAPDLFPEKLRDDILELNEIIYQRINVGVYKVGFAHSQEAYEKAYTELFYYFDQFEERLSHSRYLFGDAITDCDVRLYPTLARFDVVYHLLFKCNKKRLKDYPNLWGYARDLYQQPAFRETTDFAFIKDSYYRSPHLRKLFGNVYNILPKGPDLSEWNSPHGRSSL
ncbi:glutathione S-transferase C-terminal domain-containing protein [Lacrimispora aerotolerans]|uniref:glutathione S-transferase C-terminal domain-containing protein n=1 Tax=Lacrimispora aerotolerans TaxID=36832 RepID=UPI0004794946|nr:glutathione S-transferase C-terminal domain-containing protein [Lacrimispora aerotolerans]